LGVIYTIGPYLLPSLVRRVIADVPQMPLLLQENFTVKLLELLRQGELDVALLADPFPAQGLVTQPLYDEAFRVAVPLQHPWAKKEAVESEALKQENMLLLGNGHCFRDHVLGVCPELSRFSQSADGIQKTFEGSSLETIRHMVSAGVGITVLPSLATPQGLAHKSSKDGLLKYLPFINPKPSRRIVMAWRKSFTRSLALEALRKAVLACPLGDALPLPDAKAEYNP
jgi:LysR family transcriptional regulator, hydrogen peroxide-inducible genes activator